MAGSDRGGRARWATALALLLLTLPVGGCQLCWFRGEAPSRCPVDDDDDTTDDDDTDDDDTTDDDDATPDPCLTAPDTLVVGAASVPLVCVPPGDFIMGSPPGEDGRVSDEVQHRVEFADHLLAAAWETTQGLYLEVVGFSPSECIYGCSPTHPVQSVSWYDAVDFCNELSDEQGLTAAYDVDGSDVAFDVDANGWRLPTESEWEFLARAGEAHRFSGSDDLAEVGWCTGAEQPYEARVVGDLAPNAWGLHDMTGNVAEWVWDRPDDYPDETVEDPTGATFGSFRMHRGGAFPQTDNSCRVARRGEGSPGTTNWNRGFRVVRSLVD